MTILLTYRLGKQVFQVAILPQRLALNSACLKGVLVIANFLAFSFCFFFHFFPSSPFFYLYKKDKWENQTLKA